MVVRILIALAALLALLAIIAAVYFYHNMNYDKNTGKILAKAGFTEKQALLPDGTVLNYGEGPDNGPALFFLHGQAVTWEDYVKVLPALSKKFHIYAVDCHGHGESSQDPAKYTAAAMGADFTWFLENIVGEAAIVSGHSSGGLLTAWLAANSPQWVRGIVIEDAPFFATEPGRREKTFAWLGFRDIHNFLNQSEETDYTRYYLEHDYIQTLFGPSWEKIRESAYRYMAKHPDKPLRLFYLPTSMNIAFGLTEGPYDLRFGDTFYDGSWFDGFDQAETLSRIECPSVLIHTNWQYDGNGILLAAMDGDDAARAHALMAGNELVNVNSGHNVHYEKPKEFTEIMEKFAATLPSQQ